MSQSALQVNLDALASAGRAEVRDAAGAWIRLHSARDPRAEARSQASDIARRAESAETVVLIAGGLGYTAEALLENHSHRVIVVELSADLARASLSRRDWSAWREAGRFDLRVWPGVDEPSPMWQLFDRDEPEPLIVVQPVVARIAGELVERVRQHVKRVVFDGRANADARRRQAGPYLANTLSNLGPIARSADAGALKDVLEGVPAVLVAAGPSLDATLPVLADVADKVAIIAVDTALRPLLNAGIQPPLAVALDPTDLNGTHLLDLSPHDSTWLVAEPSVAPPAIHAFQDRLLTFRVADHHPWPWLASNGIERHLVRVWGSVLTAALDLAIYAGADPIVFVGADLAYTNGQPYCRNATWERHWAEVTGRGAALDDLWRSDLAARPLETVHDVQGRDTVTTAPLIAFRDWLVSRFAEHPERRFINATGAGILGGSSIVQAELRAIDFKPGPVADQLVEQLRRVSGEAAQEGRLKAQRLQSALCSLASDSSNGTMRVWLDFGRHTLDRDALDRTLATASAALASTASSPDHNAAPSPIAADLLPAATCAALLCAVLRGARTRVDARESRIATGDGYTEAFARLREIFGSVRQGTVLTVRADLANEAGLVPASLLFTLPPDLRRSLYRFEDALARLVTSELPSFHWSDGVAALSAVAGCPADTAFALVLLHEFLSVTGRTSHLDRVDSPATVRWALGRLLSLYAVRAEVTDCASRVDVVVSPKNEPDRDWDVSQLTRRLIGLVGIESPEARSATFVRVVSSPDVGPELRVLNLPIVRVPVERVSPGRLAQAGTAYVLDETSAMVTPAGAVASVRIHQNGGIEPLQSWPRAIWGEMPWGVAGGGFAWHPPDQVLLFRAASTAHPIVCDAPFSPLRVAPLEDGSSLWCAAEGGVWRWKPGDVPELLIETPAPAHLRLVDGGVRIDPATRLGDGAHVRKRLPLAWRWNVGDSTLEEISLDDDGQCTSYETSGAWTARVHPYADTVILTGPNGLRARLTAYYPLMAAWAGGSLVLCTGEWEVFFFPDLANRLEAATRPAA